MSIFHCISSAEPIWTIHLEKQGHSAADCAKMRVKYPLLFSILIYLLLKNERKITFKVKGSEVTSSGKKKKSISLTDHVIGDVNLDFPLRLKSHLAFDALVGLLL